MNGTALQAMLGALILAGFLCMHRAAGDLGPLSMYPSSVYPYARCLDGSQAGYYMVPAANATDAAKKWLLVLDGGGLCSHQGDCTSRSHTDLGSSTVCILCPA